MNMDVVEGFEPSRLTSFLEHPSVIEDPRDLLREAHPLNEVPRDHDGDRRSSRDGVLAKQAITRGALKGDTPAKHVRVFKLLQRGLWCI
jgi:hypothetical protein